MSTIPHSIFELLRNDCLDSAFPKDRELDEIHLLDGTRITAENFVAALPEMIAYRDEVEQKCIYSPYTAIAKVIVSRKI